MRTKIECYQLLNKYVINNIPMPDASAPSPNQAISAYLI